MVSSVVLKNSTKTLPTIAGRPWKKRRNDPAMTAGTLVRITPRDPVCWPSQANSPANGTIKNMVDGAAALQMGSAPLTFANGGFNFTTSGNQFIATPKLPSACKGFVVIWWGQPGTQTQASTEVFGDNHNSTGRYWMRCVSGSTYEVGIAGVATNITGGLSTTEKNQVALIWKPETDGTYLGHVLVNTVEKNTIACPSALPDPDVAIANAGIGDVPGAGYGGTWVGNFKSFMLTDLTNDPSDPFAIVTKDWNANKDFIV